MKEPDFFMRAICLACAIFCLLSPSLFAEDAFEPALASFSISPAIVPPSAHVRCDFTFTNQGDGPAAMEEKIFLHFIDPSVPDRILWQADHVSPVATLFWANGEIIEDGPIYVDIPDNTPDGEYGVRVGLWNPGSGERSLDKILPVTVIVDRSAPVDPPEQVEPLDENEESRRNRAMTNRFQSGEIVRLENSSTVLQLKPKEGLFCLIHSEIGELWQSLPQSQCFGHVRASSQAERIHLPLNDLSVVKANGRECVLAKNHDGVPVVELTFKLEDAESAVTVSWKPGLNWTIDRIEFDAMVWTTETLGGGVIIPRLMGQFFPVDAAHEFRQVYKTYDGWDGLHIPTSAIQRTGSAAILSWDSPDVSVLCQLQPAGDELVPGNRLLSIGLQCESSARCFRIDLASGHSYVDVAQTYRDRARQHGNLIPWKKRSGYRRIAEKLFGAAEFKPFVLVRQARTGNGETTFNASTYYTSGDCLALLRHLKNDLELKKVLFVLAGWIHRGYDNQHPDILPAAPEIGGDDGVRCISDLARSCGYLFGLHDNYQDMYEDAPSWNPAMIMKTWDGQGKRGGVWAGGQAWLIASNWGLELAKRNLPEVKSRYNPNAYFIDTTFAAPLYESFDPDSPLTRIGDLKYKHELFKYTSRMFGVSGSETGTEFGVPVCHYFEGILSGAPLVKNYPEPGAEIIPFFSLVFHDCIAMYTHQGDRTGIGDAKKVLKHLIYGTMPLYHIEPHRYWEIPIPEPDLSKPEYCFARYEGGWGKGMHPVDRFIKNTYEFLSPFAAGVATEPMTNHLYLKDDKSVEFSTFGEYWQVVVNYGPGDYRYGDTILPPMGFIAQGPDFLAQHYYPKFGDNHTCLVVKNGDETFYGFR